MTICKSCGEDHLYCRCPGGSIATRHEPAGVSKESSVQRPGMQRGEEQWLELPTRAGWWWWLSKQGTCELVKVKNFGTLWAPRLCAYAEEWGGYTVAMLREYKGGWWSGPVEPPAMPTEAPPHTVRVSDSPAENLNLKSRLYEK